jgi:hypothetical protein
LPERADVSGLGARVIHGELEQVFKQVYALPRFFLSVG